MKKQEIRMAENRKHNNSKTRENQTRSFQNISKTAINQHIWMLLGRPISNDTTREGMRQPENRRKER
jgi:hypothetical protein